jgi:signal transduction histidine kinase
MTKAMLAPRPRASASTALPQRSPALGERLIVEVATAEDARAAIGRLIALLRRTGLERVEWWAPSEAGHALQLEVCDGEGQGERSAISLGPVGTLVLVGDLAAQLILPVTRVVPLLRRHWTEEQLSQHVVLLARHNEALEDFAALVAHELKAPLHAALRQSGPSGCVAQALATVDSILEIARAKPDSGLLAPVARCLEEALHDLGDFDADVVADVPATLPMPPAALRLLFRNLIGNALAAGARRIDISAAATTGRWTLLVDDDGAGLDAPICYASGSGLGLNLCRRLVARLGGALELTPRPRGGARATLVLAGGVR